MPSWPTNSQDMWLFSVHSLVSLSVLFFYGHWSDLYLCLHWTSTWSWSMVLGIKVSTYQLGKYTYHHHNISESILNLSSPYSKSFLRDSWGTWWFNSQEILWSLPSPSPYGNPNMPSTQDSLESSSETLNPYSCTGGRLRKHQCHNINEPVH